MFNGEVMVIVIRRAIETTGHRFEVINKISLEMREKLFVGDFL